MADASTLRDRLLGLRADVLGQLAAADRIEPGHLALLPGINAALTALDAVPVDAEPAARAIITDIPGESIAVALYGEDGKAASVELSPRRAIGLAGELIAAGLRRL